MRWFIVLLLIANAVLFLWIQQESLIAPTKQTIPPPDVGQLRLRNEPAVSVTQAEAESGDEPQLAQVDEPSGGDTVSPPTDNEPVSSTPNVTTTEDTSVSAAERPVVEQQPAAPPAVSEPDEQTLAAQPPPPSPEPMPPEPPAIEPPRPEPVVATHCARIGPLGVKQADRLRRDLPREIELLSDNSEKGQQVDGYYALILPLETREEGRRMVKALADAGFTDTWLFRGGEFRNGISLGMFRRQDGARRQVATVGKKGFDAVVRARYKTGERRWLVIKRVGDGDLQGALTLPRGVKLEPQSCP